MPIPSWGDDSHFYNPGPQASLQNMQIGLIALRSKQSKVEQIVHYLYI